MSISGVQDKISLRLGDGELVPSEAGGEYILKPIPSAVIPAASFLSAAGKDEYLRRFKDRLAAIA